MRLKKEVPIDSLPVWYEPYEVKYSPIQLEFFVLPNLADLEVGDYPSQPTEYRKYDELTQQWKKFEQSPYKNIKGGSYFKPEAYFVKATIIAADINARIARISTTVNDRGHLVPVTGQLLFDRYTRNTELDDILYDEAYWMLQYISGWRNKDYDYKEWKDSIKKKTFSK